MTRTFDGTLLSYRQSSISAPLNKNFFAKRNVERTVRGILCRVQLSRGNPKRRQQAVVLAAMTIFYGLHTHTWRKLNVK